MIEKTTTKKLPATEQQEVLELLRLRAPDRFVSDEGDGMAFLLLLWLASVGGIVAFFVAGLPYDIGAIAREVGVGYAIRASLMQLSGVGFCVAVVVFFACPAYFFRVHHRFGWLRTSFGVVRVKGPSLRVLRYRDVVKVERQRFGGARGRRFTAMTLTAQNGQKLVTYATPLMDAIEAAVAK